MSANDLIFLVLVAGGAFYAGYQAGRYKALAELGGGRPQPQPTDVSPLPGPLDRPFPEPPPAAPPHPRAAPPPASAGNTGGSWADAGAAPSGSAPPRRTTKPPPAAAGLMGTGETGKPSDRSK